MNEVEVLHSVELEKVPGGFASCFQVEVREWGGFVEFDLGLLACSVLLVRREYWRTKVSSTVAGYMPCRLLFVKALINAIHSIASNNEPVLYS